MNLLKKIYEAGYLTHEWLVRSTEFLQYEGEHLSVLQMLQRLFMWCAISALLDTHLSPIETWLMDALLLEDLILLLEVKT